MTSIVPSISIACTTLPTMVTAARDVWPRRQTRNRKASRRPGETQEYGGERGPHRHDAPGRKRSGRDEQKRVYDIRWAGKPQPRDMKDNGRGEGNPDAAMPAPTGDRGQPRQPAPASKGCTSNRPIPAIPANPAAI